MKSCLLILLAMSFFGITVIGFKAGAQAQAKDTSRSSSSGSSSALRLDGFIDVEGRLSSESTLPNRGFTLNDGSLFLSKDFDRAKALVDLPFYSDLSGGTNHFIFADQKAQAYVSIDRWMPVTLVMGQYDTFMGVEQNASSNRFFANVGILKQYLLPYTHTGAQGTFHVQNLLIRGQLTDPNGAGSLGQANPEAALNFRYDAPSGSPATSASASYGAASISYNQAAASTPNGSGNLLIDATFGTTVQKFRLDGEFDIKQTPFSSRTAIGAGVFGSVPINETLSLGGRLEFIANAYSPTLTTNGSTYDSVVDLAVGPSYRLQKDLFLRGDFSIVNLSVSANNDTNYIASVSLIALL